VPGSRAARNRCPPLRQKTVPDIWLSPSHSAFTQKQERGQDSLSAKTSPVPFPGPYNTGWTTPARKRELSSTRAHIIAAPGRNGLASRRRTQAAGSPSLQNYPLKRPPALTPNFASSPAVKRISLAMPHLRRQASLQTERFSLQTRKPCKLNAGRSRGAVRVNNRSMWIIVDKVAPFMGSLPKQKW